MRTDQDGEKDKGAEMSDWSDAIKPMGFDEIKARNYPGRVFELNQKNLRQLQLDVEWLLTVSDKDFTDDMGPGFAAYNQAKALHAAHMAELHAARVLRCAWDTLFKAAGVPFVQARMSYDGARRQSEILEGLIK